MKKYICELCGKEHDGTYGSGRFCCEKCKNHYISLVAAQTSKRNGTKQRPKNCVSNTAPYGTWKCKFCNEVFKTRRLLAAHRQLNQECNKRVAWNKGLTKETNSIIAQSSLKISTSLKQLAKDGQIILGRASSPEKEELRRQKISTTMKKNPYAGGKRLGSGRGQQGWYKGFWCDSSWELAWVIYNLDHNIQFTRYTGYFEYIFNNDKHKYYPDFQLEDGTIVEVKGIEDNAQWKAKLSQFPSTKKLQIIGKHEITKYLDYVISKYGKNFIEMYDIKRQQKD